MRQAPVRNINIFREVLDTAAQNFVFGAQNLDKIILIYDFFLQFLDKIVHKGNFCFKIDESVFCFAVHFLPLTILLTMILWLNLSKAGPE